MLIKVLSLKAATKINAVVKHYKGVVVTDFYCTIQQSLLIKKLNCIAFNFSSSSSAFWSNRMMELVENSELHTAKKNSSK